MAEGPYWTGDRLGRLRLVPRVGVLLDPGVMPRFFRRWLHRGCRHKHAMFGQYEFRPDHTVARPWWCPECGAEGCSYAGNWTSE